MPISNMSVSKGIRRQFKKASRSKYLLFMMLFPFAYLIIFCYLPIYGVRIAFMDYNIFLGIDKSDWVGFANFISFFKSVYFGRLLRNTLVISLLHIILAFPASILFALMVNEIRNKHLKKAAQSIAYLPHFISAVVVAGLVMSVLATRTGILNQIRAFFGLEKISFLNEADYFPWIIVAADIWQGTGWGSIIYLAAITAIDPTLYEAAMVDGASRFKQLLNITLPSIMPTIIIQFILRIGSMFTVGYQKILLLYNESVYERADVIGTYVYRRGLLQQDYSFGSAVDLFNNVLNFIMLITFNAICRRFSETSLW